jgi:hypothetical protein
VYRLGSAAARERIWIQCDAAADATAAAGAAWAILESLTGGRVSRHRHLVLGRAHLAVVTPTAAPRRLGADGGLGAAPLLDAGALGASAGVLAALDRFAPTLVVHYQDWAAAPGGGGRRAAHDGRLGLPAVRGPQGRLRVRRGPAVRGRAAAAAARGRRPRG